MKQTVYLLIAMLGLCIKSFSQSSTDDKMIAFAKLYSTIKFYYPEPQLKDFPWNALAYKGYQLALENENDDTFIAKTKELFATIAPAVQIGKGIVFNPNSISPSNKQAFPTTKFWQHAVGLNVNKKQTFASNSLNYIYGQKNVQYKLIQLFNPKQKGMLGKRIKISFWAKWEGALDSNLNLFQLTPYNRKTKTFEEFTIKATQQGWTKYEKEIEYPEEAAADKLLFCLPISGTIYVDDLQLEKQENNEWEKIIFNNTNFEKYSPNGNLVGWEDPFIAGSIVEKNAKDSKEGNFSLKLNAVQEQIKYQPTDIENPYEIKLTEGYNAFVPLQLLANDSLVYPSVNKMEISKLAENLVSKIDSTAPANQQKIAAAFEIWSQLYQDYPYRENNFEEKNNHFFLTFIHKLEHTNNSNLTIDFYIDYLSWLNDPHVSVVYKNQSKEQRKKFRIPIEIALTENDCVVSLLKKPSKTIALGDVIKKINNIDIDSLRTEYKRYSIAKINQYAVFSRLLDVYQSDSAEVIFKHDNKIVKEKFYAKNGAMANNSPMAQSSTDSLAEEIEEQEYKNNVEELMKKNNAYYFNAIATKSLTRNDILTEAKVDSLVTIFNNYKYVIIDVRGRPNNLFLNYLETHISAISMAKKIDVVKRSFNPVANFLYDTINLTQSTKSDLVLKSNIIYLVNYKTMSAAERNLIRVQHAKSGIIIGENTAGAAGSINKVRINDNVEFYYTSSKIVGLDYMPNKNYQSTGLKPNYIIYPTSAGMQEGKDEVMEKALDVISKLK